MSSRLLPLLLLCATLIPLTEAAEEKPARKQATEEEIRARLQQHQLKKRTESAAPSKASRETGPEASVAKSIEENPPAKQAAQQPAEANANAKKAAPENPTVLPRVEVRKDRITEIDRQVAKQNKQIARERQNTKPTALDETLNGPKTSKWLALFGGQSSEDRANLARERVSMMEDERDLIEAMEQAQTPEEKAQLQRTLDSMRAMRRELEASLR